jgi:hypothetical protein
VDSNRSTGTDENHDTLNKAPSLGQDGSSPLLTRDELMARIIILHLISSIAWGPISRFEYAVETRY